MKPLFRTDSPSVEATALTAPHSGYVVLVNHNAKAENVTVTATAAIHALRLITSQGPQPVQLEGMSWKMNIDAYDAVVVEWK